MNKVLESRLASFCEIYVVELVNAVRKHPDQYGWPEADATKVCGKMIAAMRAGTFNKDGYAFKATCRRLGIVHTYKAIKAYLAGEDR